MDYETLGRTNLRVSVMSLGAGGHSRLGKAKNEREAERIVRQAVDRGVNLIDTAEVYGTEDVVGAGIRDTKRDDIYVSTKFSMYNEDGLRKAAHIEQRVDHSLQQLQTDYIDIYHLHGVRAADYDYAKEFLVPALIRMQEKGKIRFIGITEGFASDTRHDMLQKAIQDHCWDVMMVGFNMLNQSAREVLFPATIEKDIGVLCMFAVRRALSNPQVLREQIQQACSAELLAERHIDPEDPLGFFVQEGVAESIQDAAYRFCRYEPGIHSVLSGTGNPDHLVQNIDSLNREPLPSKYVQRVRNMFAGIDSLSGE